MRQRVLFAGLVALAIGGAGVGLFVNGQDPVPVQLAFRKNASVDAPATPAPIADRGSSTELAYDPRRNLYFRGITGSPVDLEGQNVKAYVDSRIAKARGGDAAAAWEVYRAESVCARVTNDQEYQNNPPTGTPESALKENAAEIAALERACEGMVPSQVAERLNFLTVAARAGNPEAAAAFYREGPNGNMDLLLIEPNDPAVVQWKSDAVGYLTNAAQGGDWFALFLLAGVYQAGVLAPQDLEKSLTCWVASATLLGRDTHRIMAIRDYDQLTPAQKQIAVKNGVALAHTVSGAKS